MILALIKRKRILELLSRSCHVEELLDEWLKEEENISAEDSAELDKLKKIYPTVEVLGSFKVIISLFGVGVQASVPIVSNTFF